jgi:hypothetical protein
MHDRYIQPSETKTAAGVQQKQKRKLTGVKEGTADLDVSGAIRNVYVDNSSYIFPVFRRRLPSGQVERWIEPHSEEIISKCRSPLLGDREPADLRYIVKKLKG